MNSAPTDLKRAPVLGIPIAVANYESVMDWMDARIAANRPASVTAAAVNLIMAAHEYPDVMDAVLDATLVVPDGQPLVWALHLLGQPKATRVYGPDLMAHYCARCARSQTPIYLHGGRDLASVQLLARLLQQRFPGLVIAGAGAEPFRTLTSEEEEEIIGQINDSGAHVVWIGTGQPRQELWMSRLRERLAPPLLVAVGAAFDFHAGLTPQAPPWMGRHGLEWTYRLAREPRRLWRRYARYNPRFVVAFARQYTHHVRARRA